MDINILKNEKEEIEVELENLTLAELLRVYLNEDSGVVFAAWKREHYTKKPVLKVQTKGKTAKKALNDAIAQVIKELDKLEEDFKKLK
ncbi:MAG: RpoL/Rpb11 RNA polymerase subunit family protein [Candidatus Pacearchaeota archaeon]|jgi:DNA-directed RNA polymerase subunit L